MTLAEEHKGHRCIWRKDTCRYSDFRGLTRPWVQNPSKATKELYRDQNYISISSGIYSKYGSHLPLLLEVYGKYQIKEPTAHAWNLARK